MLLSVTGIDKGIGAYQYYLHYLHNIIYIKIGITVKLLYFKLRLKLA